MDCDLWGQKAQVLTWGGGGGGADAPAHRTPHTRAPAGAAAALPTWMADWYLSSFSPSFTGSLTLALRTEGRQGAGEPPPPGDGLRPASIAG